MTYVSRLVWLLITLPLLCVMTPAAAIVCGKAVPPGEQPWLVQVVRLNAYGKVYNGTGGTICSGSLLESRIVVTAAHCIKAIGAGRMGVIAWTEHGASEPHRVTNHHSFADDQANDVALLLLDSPAEIAAYPRLPDEHVDIASVSTAQIAGYGTVWPTETETSKNQDGRICPPHEAVTHRTASPSPRQGTVEILDPRDCSSDKVNDADINAKTILCVHGPRLQPSGICGGDSGGPLIALNSTNEPTIIGVAHRVPGFQSENPESCIANPGVFSPVAPLVQRIQITTKNLLPSIKPTTSTKLVRAVG